MKNNLCCFRAFATTLKPDWKDIVASLLGTLFFLTCEKNVESLKEVGKRKK
jgi:hypothetical protein